MKKSSKNSAEKKDSFDYSKNEEMVKRIPIENTPFMKIWTKEEGWILVMGNYALTKPILDEKEFEEHIHQYKHPRWNKLVQIMLCLIDNNEQKNSKKQ